MKLQSMHAAAWWLSLMLAAGMLFGTGCAGVLPQRTSSGTFNEPTEDEIDAANELFLTGKMAEAREDYGQAIASYMEALQYDPYADEIAYALATTFIRDGKFRSSLIYAYRAVELNEDEAEYWQLVQYVEERFGNYENAAKALEKYISLTPDQAMTGDVKLVQYYFAIDRGDDAKKILLNRADDEYTPADQMYEIAQILAFNDMTDEAVDVLETLIARDPVDVQAWLYLGDLYSSLGEDEMALATYQKALENNPDNLFVLVTIGNQCLLENDWDCAINYLEQAAAKGPQAAEEASINFTDILKTLTSVFYYGGRDRDAEALFESLKESGDDDASLYFSLGKAMAYLERYEESVGYYRTGFEIDISDISPDSRLRALSGYTVSLVYNDQENEALRIVREDAPRYVNNTPALKSLEASIYMELERYDDAIPIFQWLSSSDPENPSYLYSLSLACDLGGNFDDAETAILKVLEMDPEDPLALNNLAYMYLEHDMNLDQALSMVQQALINEPHNGAYLDTLAWAYFKIGNVKKARKEIERALKWAGEDDIGVIYEHYGDILAELDKTNEARDAYKNAIEQGEDDDRINAKIEALDR